jgi:ActR/RegA family two-component response regulator
LVGHCGADTAYLKLAVKKAVGSDVDIRNADDAKSLDAALTADSVDLILFNRELGYGFATGEGIDAIRALRPLHADVKMMLVTNYPEYQQAAVAAGATPGFGKRELGSPRVTELLREALGIAVAK